MYRREGHVPTAHNRRQIHNLGEIRAELPEYGEYLAAGRTDAAVLTHEEASQVTAQIAALAVQRRLNVVFDLVGGDDTGQFSRKIRPLLARGYDVTVRYASVPVDLALERAEKRHEETGRQIPEDLIRAKHAEVSRGLVTISELPIGRIEIYCTQADVPELIAEGAGGNGLSGILARDPERYAEFLRKGQE